MYGILIIHGGKCCSGSWSEINIRLDASVKKFKPKFTALLSSHNWNEMKCCKLLFTVKSLQIKIILQGMLFWWLF